jgi:uncharacterized Zn finger protein (UPF0148 family)
MEQELCERCKVVLVKTELADVYKCPVCKGITSKRLDKEE